MLIRIAKDEFTPRLRRLLALARHPREIMRAAGERLKSITEGNFNAVGSQYRPAAWPPKRDGTPSNLQKSNTLSRSFFLEFSDDSATVGNPMPYAAIHQFGGTITAKGKALCWVDGNGVKHFAKRVVIPARPFFPLQNGQLTHAAAAAITASAQRAAEQQANG